jgi:hypothetical protein
MQATVTRDQYYLLFINMVIQLQQFINYQTLKFQVFKLFGRKGSFVEEFDSVAERLVVPRA